MDNYKHSLDSVFHALADPTRRAVIEQLSQRASTISELAEPFSMALPSFMKHISVLEKSGLIGSKKVGRVRTCEIKPEIFSATQTWLDEQRTLWEGRTGRLAEHVENLTNEEK